jgi:hypothetical protein
MISRESISVKLVNNVESWKPLRKGWAGRSTLKSWTWLRGTSSFADLITSIWRFDRVEKKEQALKKMMATVLKDKSMIEDTIVELDRYKRDALMKTWEKVNGWAVH